MATLTTNYNLVKPSYEDNADIAVVNNNMDLIDAALGNKVEKAAGKDLSSNDYTADEKTKLAGIDDGANKYVHPGEGTNPHGTTKEDLELENVDNVKQMPVSGGMLENYGEKLITMAPDSGTVDLSLGNVFKHAPGEDLTYEFSNAVSGQAHSFTLIIEQGDPSYVLTFPEIVKWAGAEAPDINTAGKTYLLTFLSIDGGATWLGLFGGEF